MPSTDLPPPKLSERPPEAILSRLRMQVACGFNRAAPQIPQPRCP